MIKLLLAISLITVACGVKAETFIGCSEVIPLVDPDITCMNYQETTDFRFFRVWDGILYKQDVPGEVIGLVIKGTLCSQLPKPADGNWGFFYVTNKAGVLGTALCWKS